MMFQHRAGRLTILAADRILHLLGSDRLIGLCWRMHETGKS